MGLFINDFKNRIVTPTLQYLDDVIPYSIEAEQLVLCTCQYESALARVVQIGGGPARGPGQMEGWVDADIHTSVLAFDAALNDRVTNLMGGWPTGDGLGDRPSPLEGNWFYATAMTRMQYWRYPEPIPAPGDAQGQGELYKLRYNTAGGAGTVEGYVETFNGFVAPLYGPTEVLTA